MVIAYLETGAMKYNCTNKNNGDQNNRYVWYFIFSEYFLDWITWLAELMDAISNAAECNDQTSYQVYKKWYCQEDYIIVT